eukprot:CAMPEP_0177620198 /NCGR_PEP_ID=MMETSP0419_2-20121207/26744_1 /TAXON_ID=582737 /ORGANISM="Tetraselmis sp., Strain GSL018" /LENGTH=85 /DNA_ID=CAMNT_0019119673 /DNA_START=65 /DNA_END=319 /DNA_ORIENTATION=+
MGCGSSSQTNQAATPAAPPAPAQTTTHAPNTPSVPNTNPVPAPTPTSAVKQGASTSVSNEQTPLSSSSTKVEKKVENNSSQIKPQ